MERLEIKDARLPVQLQVRSQVENCLKYLSEFEYIVKYLSEFEEKNELGQMYLFLLPFICHQLIIFWGIIGLPVVWQVNSSKRFEILVLFPCLNVDKMIFQCFRLFEIKIIFVQCAHYWKYDNNLWQQYSNIHEDQYCLNIFTIGVTIFRPHFINNVDTNIYALFVWYYSKQWLQIITFVWQH